MSLCGLQKSMRIKGFLRMFQQKLVKATITREDRNLKIALKESEGRCIYLDVYRY